MHRNPLELASVFLTFAAAVSQAILVVYLIRTRRFSRHRIFSTYCAFFAITTGLGLASYLYASSHQFFYLYWAASFLFIALEFGVMYEVFVNILKPYSAIVDLGKMVFAWASIFLFAAATITALATTGSEVCRLQAAVSVGERSMRFMECGLLLLFFLFEKKLSISWRNTNIAIAMGLGITAALDLTNSLVSSHFPGFATQVNLVYLAVFLGTSVLWLYCFYAQTDKSSVLDSPNRLIFQRWNEALVTYGYAGAAASPSTVECFLPGIEKTVDRVMARRVV